ncbi:MAG: hypothetical protein ACOYIR_01200 [Christensenellales bacterium]|jgi:hypothetical protein
MKKKHVFRVLCALLAVLALAVSPPAMAAQKKDSEPVPRIYPVRFGRTRLAMMKDGSFARAKLSRAKVGEQERFAVSLMCSELAADGEQAVVRVTSEGYDFSKCEPILLIPVDDVYYASKLVDYEADEHSLSAVVRVSYLGVNKDTPVFLYFAPKKTAEQPEVSLNVSRKKETQFDFGQSIIIGDYTIQKQGGMMPVEVALGMARMDEEDTVYLISDEKGKEILRLVVHEGELYGIAVKDNGVVVSLEYSFSKKAYVSAISGKALIKKDQVVDIFRQLGISFTNPPDEEKWLEDQTIYSTNRTIRILDKPAGN